MAKDKNGICKLCGKSRKLCKSHIIPEYFYSNCYFTVADKEGRRTHVFDAKESNPNPNRVIQKGWWEFLLCKECECNINDQYEKRFKNFWYDDSPIPDKVKIDEICTIQFDRDLLRGLLLSIIWRAGVAEKYPFLEIKLGPHEDKIKKILKHEIIKPAIKYMNHPA
nr:hypothetical protein [uncultured Desulfobacter sp.]